MNSTLCVRLQPISNPYNDLDSKFYIWENIRICIADHIFIDFHWDIYDFIEWFYERKESLIVDLFPYSLAAKSICQKYDILKPIFIDLYEQGDSVKWDELCEYWEKHYFILRGTNTKRFFIGLDENHDGELSYFEKTECSYKVYKFNMLEFIENTQLEIKAFLKNWKNSYYEADAFNKLILYGNENNINLM